MLGKLGELRKFQLEEDEADVRGWRVFDREEHEVGIVDSLVVDTGKERISHFGVRMGDRVRLVPVEQILINQNEQEILLPDATADNLDRYPVFLGKQNLLERERQYYITFAPEGIQAGATEKGALRYENASIEALESSEWNRSENDGRCVSIEGSFGQSDDDCWNADGVSYLGYKLWDHEGNGIRVANVFSLIDPETGERDETNDFKPNIKKALAFRYGTFVRIEGRYLAHAFEGGEPGLSVDYIEGTALEKHLQGKR